MDHLASRVVARYVNATSMPSQAALAFLTKAAKGIKGSLSPEAMEEALPLIGWSIEPVVVPVLLTGEQAVGVLKRKAPEAIPKGEMMYGNLRDKKELFRYKVEDMPEIQRMYQAVRHHTIDVSDRKGPTNPQADQVYIRNLTSPTIDTSFRGEPRPMFTFDEVWYAMDGWKITSPKGSVEFAPKLDFRGRILSTTEEAPDKPWTFMYKAGLKEAAKAYLDSIGDEQVQRVLKPVDPRSLENTGTCPCCFRNIKLVGGRMIRHGWSVEGRRQRGVHGQTWHSGPCFGAEGNHGIGYEPFEISAEGTKQFLERAVRPGIERLTRQISHLEARPEQIAVEDYRGKVIQVHCDTTEMVWGNEGRVSKYDQALRQKIAEAKMQLRMATEEAGRLEHVIAGWKPKPLPGTPT